MVKTWYLLLSYVALNVAFAFAEPLSTEVQVHSSELLARTPGWDELSTRGLDEYSRISLGEMMMKVFIGVGRNFDDIDDQKDSAILERDFLDPMFIGVRQDFNDLDVMGRGLLMSHPNRGQLKKRILRNMLTQIIGRDVDNTILGREYQLLDELD